MKMITECGSVNYDQLETDTNSLELCRGSTSSGLEFPQNKTTLIDSNYIESKIKCLLNEKRIQEHLPEKLGNGESQNNIGGILITEDSCNAVDHKISDSMSSGIKVPVEDLSFNGKINCFNEKMRDTTSRSDTEDVAEIKLNSSEKLRRDKLNESLEILRKENSSLMHFVNEKSPELFDDDDSEDDSDTDELRSDSEDTALEDKSLNLSIPSSISANSLDPLDDIERSLLKRLQASLSGILPPPSMTFSNIDVHRMLTLYRENEARFFYQHKPSIQESTSNEELSESGSRSNCLCRPTHTKAEIEKLDWPELLTAKGHGLYYNRSTISEKFELLGLKYIDRYVGAETSSTFNITRSPSSSKKRNLRLKMLNQSPGRRLSHLARRRAIFSSANLLCSSATKSNSASTSQTNSLRLCNRQILLDPKKLNNRRKNKGRTPKRRTPSHRNTPRRRTPGSSAKKRVMSLPLAKLSQHPVNRETSKRALFQSPPNDTTKPATSHTVGISSALASKVQKSKRALFSPPKRTHRFTSVSIRQDLSVKESMMSSQRYGSTNNIDMLSEQTSVRIGKRRRSIDTDEEPDVMPSDKIPKMDLPHQEDLTPKSLKFTRSQSFCVGSQNLSTKNASESSLCGKSLFRANSEVVFPDSVGRPVTTLSENHKKKLLWAVSQSLQTKQISVKHESFKHYASNLARIVRRLFLEFNDHSGSSTSERLLRLANKHVFEVIQGNSVDDIYLREKTRIMSAKNISKLHGYIAPEEYEQRNRLLKRSTSISSATFTSESSMDISPFVSSSQQFSQSSIFSQSSEFLNQLSQTSMRSSQTIATETVAVTIATDPTTSENTILRENVNNDQRQKSAQKPVSFSGKDQKNLSPYADKSCKVGSHLKTKMLVGGKVTPSILKAKRQISFE